MNGRKAKALKREVLAIARSKGDDVSQVSYQDVPVKKLIRKLEGDNTIETVLTARVTTGWKAAYKFLKKVYKKLNKRERRGVGV